MEAEKPNISSLLGCGDISRLMKHIVSAQSMSSFGLSGNYSCAFGTIKFFVKIALYPLFPQDLWKIPESPKKIMVDAEIDVMRAIKTRIIDRGYTPHFVEILAVAKCDDVSAQIEDKGKCEQQRIGRSKPDQYPPSLFCRFLDLIEGKVAINKFAIVFSEFCEFNVKEYITRYAPVFPAERDLLILSFVFQILFTLEITQRVWSSFRHGDLLPHNLMVKLIDNAEQYMMSRHFLRYKIDGKEFNVPFFGIFLKIIDFGHSEIPDEGIISSIVRAGDNWLPDYITFIIYFEELITGAGFMSPTLDKLFHILNPERIPSSVLAVNILKQRDKFLTPKSALKSHLFSMFETQANEESIVAEYIAPQ